MSKRRIRGLIQIAVSTILLVLILRQVHWAEVWDALRRIDLFWLAVAWGLFLLGVVVRAVRWRVLLDALGVHRPLRELTSWYFVGSFFNVILPTGFGGDAVRAAELSQDTGRPGPVVNSVVVDRYLGIMVLLAMGLIAGILRPGTASPSIFAFTAVLFSGGLLAAWLLRRSWWANLARRDSLLGKAVRLAATAGPGRGVCTLRSLVYRPWAGGIVRFQPAADRLERGHRLGTGAAAAGERLLCLCAVDRRSLAIAGVRRAGRARNELCRPVWQRRRAPGHRAGVIVGRLSSSPSQPGWWVV